MIVFPEAGEATMTFIGSAKPSSAAAPLSDEPSERDPSANRRRAESRARVSVRRYCAANGIDRLASLTFAPPFCTDPDELRRHLARFVRRLRYERGKKFPYVWVPELHKDGVKLHAHFGLNSFIAKDRLAELWGHGWTDIRLVRSRESRSPADHSRVTARYLSKYVGKAFDESDTFGCHRYEVAQGCQPRCDRRVFPSEQEARDWAVSLMGDALPTRVWNSTAQPDWEGPDVEVAFWSS